jgi:hypothetical protein
VTRRGDSKPPEDVARLIDLVNTKQELPDLDEWFWDAMNDPNRDRSIGRRTLWIGICSKVARKLRRETRTFLGPAIELQQFRDKYGLLRSAQQMLPDLAQRNSSQDRNNDYEGGVLAFTDVPFPVNVNFFMNDKGILAASGTFINAIQGVKPDRIRACAVCEHIFWARRINSACCSTRCRKTYNQRNKRDADRTLTKKRTSKKGR